MSPQQSHFVQGEPHKPRHNQHRPYDHIIAHDPYILKILYSLGVPPERLARMYRARADSDISASGREQDSTDKTEEQE